MSEAEATSRLGIWQKVAGGLVLILLGSAGGSGLSGVGVASQVTALRTELLAELKGIRSQTEGQGGRLKQAEQRLYELAPVPKAITELERRMSALEKGKK